MDPSTPVACTLTPADLTTQASRWKRLISQAGIERTETAIGPRLSFDLEAGQELRALVAVERECCPWAAWTVEPTAGAVVLDVRSAAPERVVALHGMFR